MIELPVIWGLVKEYGPWSIGWIFCFLMYIQGERRHREHSDQIAKIAERSMNAINNNTEIITKLTTLIQAQGRGG